MWHFILYFYSYFVYFYSLALMVSYIYLLINAYRFSTRYRKWTKSYLRNMIETSPYAPGVSIVAPAYNEEVTIVDNVLSLLEQDYPKFEVVIVNDGSKDKTLERMIERFDLIEIPYNYVYRVHCRPFKRMFRSQNIRYKNLVVVDKENGGTKADAVNGGLNVVKYPYFINTDADCLLAKDAIYQCIFPMALSHDVIAVSGTMSMSNGFELEDNRVVEYKASNNVFALFQDLEYKRSFLIGKMGWSNINAMPNVSGGYGLFDTKVVISAGGYSYDSFAEDMDMLTRMITYCCDFGIDYRVVQIPHTCCWTEGPSNFTQLKRQRKRWGRGLFQLMYEHRHVIGNYKYRRLGLITYPYIFLFEFCAPMIEVVGFWVFVYLAFTGGVNWLTFVIMFACIFLFSYMLSSFIVFYDYVLGGSYTKLHNYLKLMLAAFFEPFTYHPLITSFSLLGYFDYVSRKKASWGEMKRVGAVRVQKAETPTTTVTGVPPTNPNGNATSI